MIDIPFKYKTKKATNGAFVESFIPPDAGYSRSKIILTGFAVCPSSYLGDFPALLTLTGRPVHVVYQPGVSGVKGSRGVYNNETHIMQLNAAKEVMGDSIPDILAHSYSTIPALELALTGKFQKYQLPKEATITLASVMTDVEDVLTHKRGKHKGKQRRFAGFGPQWLTLFKMLKYFSLRVPTNPLADEKWHLGNEKPEGVKCNTSRLINLKSARAFLEYDILERVKEWKAEGNEEPFIKPLWVTPKEDQIFTPDKQVEIADLVGGPIHMMEKTGHDYFVAPYETLKKVMIEIVKNQESSLLFEERLRDLEGSMSLGNLQTT